MTTFKSSIFASSLISSFIVAASATSGLASATPNSYAYYTAPAGTVPFKTVDFSITLERDPGPMANVFWSNQFSFKNGPTGYTGMQSNGGSVRKFLFSVWGAVDAKVGDAGTYCLAGTEGTPFRSCRMDNVFWHEGQTHQFRLAAEGAGWYGVTVTETDASGAVLKTFKLGSVQIPVDNGVSPGSLINWVEYFEWNDANASCYNQPLTQAFFKAPVGDGKTLSVGWTPYSTTPECASLVTKVAGGSRHRDGLHNSVRAPIRGADNVALGMPAGLIDNGLIKGMATNVVDSKQNWVFAGDGSLRTLHDFCLTPSGTGLVGLRCNGAAAANQIWSNANGVLRNVASGLCVTAKQGVPLPAPITLEPCDGRPAQRWTAPAQ